MFNRKLFWSWIQNFVLFHVQKTRVLLLIKLKHLLWWSYRTESQSHDLSNTTSLIGVFPALKLCFLITNLLNIMSLWCLRNDKFSLKKQQVFSKISLRAKMQGPYSCNHLNYESYLGLSKYIPWGCLDWKKKFSSRHVEAVYKHWFNPVKPLLIREWSRLSWVGSGPNLFLWTDLFLFDSFNLARRRSYQVKASRRARLWGIWPYLT